MNDGIYYPFAEARFAKYQDGMRAFANGQRRSKPGCFTSLHLYSTRCRFGRGRSRRA